MQLGINGFQIGGRVLILAHFHQTVDHLQVVEKVVPLGPQLQVQRVHLLIDRLQLGDGAHPPASQQRVLNVQYRAPPGHQRPDDRNGAEGDTILPRKIHQKNVYHKNQQSQNLQGIDGNGIYDGLADIRFSRGFQHIFLRGGSEGRGVGAADSLYTFSGEKSILEPVPVLFRGIGAADHFL